MFEVITIHSQKKFSVLPACSARNNTDGEELGSDPESHGVRDQNPGAKQSGAEFRYGCKRLQMTKNGKKRLGPDYAADRSLFCDKIVMTMAATLILRKMDKINPVNARLELANQYVQYTNRNIFLTGKAGTGKPLF